MLIIGDKTIFTHIEVSNSGYFKLQGDCIKLFDKDKYYPFIHIPKAIRDNEFQNCILGYVKIACMGFVDEIESYTYFHIDFYSLKRSEIRFKNVSLVSIGIIRGEREYYYSTYGGWNNIKRPYYYEIVLKIYNRDSTKSVYCRFTSEDLLNKTIYDSNFNRYYEGQSTLMCFFKNIIPFIDQYVESDKPIEFINTSYISKMFPQKSTSYQVKIKPLNYYNTMCLIDNLTVAQNDRSEYIAVFDSQDTGYINSYIAEIFWSVLGERIDNNGRYYFFNIPYDYVKDSIAETKNSILCLLFYNVIKSFNKERAITEYLYSYKYCDRKTLQKLMPNTLFENVFGFLYSLQIVYLQKGCTVVGNDDREWEEISYTFDECFGKPSKEIIERINSTLKIELKYSPHRKSGQYYYLYRSESVAIGGLAENNVDLGSDLYRKRCLFDLLKEFAK